MGIGALLILASFASLGQPSAHQALAPRYHAGTLGLATQVGAASTPEPDYDEQIGATFVQNLPSLTFNVTALAQTGTDGYGPAYILNGLTSEGYWYQVGVSYHWPSTTGGYEAGFGFNYQVYGPDGKPVYPSEGSGLGTFSKTVDSGDTVLLSLTFSGGSVLMSAEDLETGGQAQASYSAFGASTFEGDTTGPSDAAGYFTGIMTEWYHVGEYTGSEGKVTYTDDSVTLSGAWLWADEFDSESASAPPVFDNQTKDPVIFDGSNVYPFETDGATIYGSAHQFITGLLNSAVSTITLNPSSEGTTGTATFAVTYTLAGLQQTSDIEGGSPTLIEADPGTSITVAANSTADQEKVVFGGTSDSVTVPAGDNATYVYYEVVSELVSSTVAGNGAPLPSSPVLTYDTPPSSPASTSTVVKATKTLTSESASVTVLVGTTASVEGNLTGGVSGERWATATNSWTVSAPDVLPNPITYYEQFEVGIAYWLNGTSSVGSPTPSAPSVTSTEFGQPVTVAVDQPEEPSLPASPLLASPPANGVFGGEYIGWFDAGSTFSMPSVLNGTASDRWVGAQWADQNGSASEPLTSSDVFAWEYTHQFYVTLGAFDPQGGSVAPSSGWFDAGSTVSATASADSKWQFEFWSGSGSGAYNGTSVSPSLTVTGPFAENATFYAQLAVAAGAGDKVAYSYGSQTGSVSPGATKDLYVPPGSNVTLRASPSSFLYSFISWRGSSGNSSKPSIAVFVNSPERVAASYSYDYPVLLGIGIVILAALVGLSLFARSRRRRQQLYGPWP